MSLDTLAVSKNTKEYRCRKPQYSPYYRCIEDNYEAFERAYDSKYQEKYGYFRPIVSKVIFQYLDCGILANGFARVKCRNCKHEYLLAFSCKRRHFCPSCHAKRVTAFGKFACSNVLKNVSRRHFVFSIPKIIRIYFLFNRDLLKELAKIAWEVLSCYYKNAVSKEGTAPAAICSIQTFGDMLGFNPHLHMLCADGGFGDSVIFYAVAAGLDGPSLEPLFRHKILSMLKRKGLITSRVIEDDSYNKGASKSWARLIKKIYEVDPLTCLKCKGQMRIIAFIEDYKVIKKILDWLGIDEFKRDEASAKKIASYRFI